jgi:hypothetical protein
MDFEDKKYFKKMSSYNPKENVKGYYQLMINNFAQEALSGEKSSFSSKREISSLLVAIDELNGN